MIYLCNAINCILYWKLATNQRRRYVLFHTMKTCIQNRRVRRVGWDGTLQLEPCGVERLDRYNKTAQLSTLPAQTTHWTHASAREPLMPTKLPLLCSSLAPHIRLISSKAKTTYTTLWRIVGVITLNSYE